MKKMKEKEPAMTTSSPIKTIFNQLDILNKYINIQFFYIIQYYRTNGL